MAAKGKIGIIGAGLGGLSAAIRLAQNGHDVHVYEKLDFPGGKAGSLSSCGFRFDTGPSVITMTFVLEDLFKEAGENIKDYLTLKPLDKMCKYFYTDGTIINAYSDLKKFAAEIEEKTGESKKSLRNYLNYCRRIYELTAELFLFNSLTEPKSYFKFDAVKTLFRINQIDSFRTIHEANSSFFKEKKVIQLFDRYATYNGSNPYVAPATLNVIPHVEYTLGSYFVREGVYSIPLSLAKIAEKKGVKFYYNANVEEILLENKKTKGIRVNGEKFYFDAVISNCDVNYTYKYLLKDSSSFFARQYQKHASSSSALVFYWGIRGLNRKLEAHNILFAENYKEEFDSIFQKHICTSDPTIYIHISSKYKPDDSPLDSENWFVMINVSHNGIINWNEEKYRVREIVVSKINKMLGIDINSILVFEKVMTPGDIEMNTNSFKGSIYGMSSNSRSAAFMRQANRSRKYEGLFFAGGSAHPGGGIPLVLLSGKITSRLIEKRLK